MDKLKELQEKRQQLAAKVKEFVDNADKKESWSAEDKANYDALNAEYDANLKSLNEETERRRVEDEYRAKVAADMAAIEGHRDYQPKPRARFGRDGGTVAAGPLNPLNAFGDGTYSGSDLAMSLQGWLMRGSMHAANVTEQHLQAAANLRVSLDSNIFTFNLNRDWPVAKANAYGFRNALSGEDGSSGGYTKDQTLINNLELAMLAYGGVMQVAEIIRTATGEIMRWPTANDTSNTGRQVGENASHDAGTDPTFGEVLWNAYTFTSDIVKVPNELMTDSVFNMPTVLGQMLGQRLGRIQNTKYTTGTGAGTAKGITLCAAAGVTAASATAIAFDELIDLEHSLDPSRRNMPGVGYMFHDSILKALRKLKDGEGRYLWQAGANSGAPDTLNTYPYQVNQDMASSIAASAITVLFGELPAYKVRQVGQIVLRRLDERFADTNQTGFLAIMRGDGNLLDAGDHPIKKLTQHS